MYQISITSNGPNGQNPVTKGTSCKTFDEVIQLVSNQLRGLYDGKSQLAIAAHRSGGDSGDASLALVVERGASATEEIDIFTSPSDLSDEQLEDLEYGEFTEDPTGSADDGSGDAGGDGDPDSSEDGESDDTEKARELGTSEPASASTDDSSDSSADDSAGDTASNNS